MISAGPLANVVIYSCQVGVIVAGASLLPPLLRLDNAGARYAYWRAVGILCLVLPWVQPYRERAAIGTARAGAVVSDIVSISPAGSSAPVTTDWAALAVASLAIGAVLRLAWLALGLRRLRQLRLSTLQDPSHAGDADFQRTLGTWADIRHTSRVAQPVTFGLRRPLVLLPDRLSHAAPDIRRAVVGHELVHVKRRDWTWLVLEEIAVSLFWFHPAVWWLVSQIQLAREEVVDEMAILLTGRRKAYIEALVAFADSTSVLPIAAFARRRHLFRRIALVSKEDVMSSRRIVASCAAMALVVAAGSWYTVSALPLRRAAQVSTQKGPGPLERSAHAVTPENPIPRRVHAEDPIVPNIPGVTGATVIVQVTIDELGRIVEARATEAALKGAEFSVGVSGDDLAAETARLERSRAGISAEAAAVVRQALPAFVDSTLASVRQWRYEAPVKGPLTFNVPVRLGAAPEIMAFKAADTPASGGGTFGAAGTVKTPGSEAGRVQRSTSSDPDDALRVGGAIKSPLKIRDVRPVYPPIAREAGVSGVVIIEAKIGADGSIEDARVLRSIPLLDEAALDAVKQWRFVPTLLNGKPVPIIMTMTVNFALEGLR
jgi:TonB family protein